MRRMFWWVAFGGLVTRAVQRVKAVTAPTEPKPDGATWTDLSL